MRLQNAGHQRASSQHLLRINQSLRTEIVQPETRRDENQQREPEEKATLPLKAGLADEFLEWAQVHGDREDRLYGTLKSSVLDPLNAGRDLVMSIDVQGVESLRRVARTHAPLQRAMTTIFIVLDHERLVARMRGRAKDHDDEIARRLATAEAELREAAKFDATIESRTRDEDFAALLAIERNARVRAAQGTGP